MRRDAAEAAPRRARRRGRPPPRRAAPRRPRRRARRARAAGSAGAASGARADAARADGPRDPRSACRRGSRGVRTRREGAAAVVARGRGGRAVFIGWATAGGWRGGGRGRADAPACGLPPKRVIVRARARDDPERSQLPSFELALEFDAFLFAVAPAIADGNARARGRLSRVAEDDRRRAAMTSALDRVRDACADGATSESARNATSL